LQAGYRNGSEDVWPQAEKCHFLGFVLPAP
jgi:hypothetical protein